MESYIVRLTETAKNDMYEIYYYIADRLLSPENAIGQYNRIADSILSLIFNISNCGDNCAKYILELAENRDIKVTLHHIMNFGSSFSLKVINDRRRKIITDPIEYLMLGHQYLRGGNNEREN